jgi:hypothetical protein
MDLGDILPKQKPETKLFRLHISYFIQNCKKANPRGFPFLKISEMRLELRHITGFEAG